MNKEKEGIILENIEQTNSKRKEKQNDLKQSIKQALILQEKVNNSEIEENKNCVCGGIFYQGIYDSKDIIVCNKCHRVKFFKRSIIDNSIKNNNQKKIIFKDIPTDKNNINYNNNNNNKNNNNNNKIYKKPLLKLGLDLSKSMVKEKSTFKQLERNKINLLNSTDLTFRSLLKSYYNTINNKKEIIKEEEEKDNKNNNKMNKNISELSSDLNMNEYKMIKLIGSGSYSNIYLIENYKSKKQYAAKKIITDGENELEKIKMEIEILKTLSELNEEDKNFFVPIYKYSIKKLDITSYSIYFLMPLAISDWGKEIKDKNKFFKEDFLLKILKKLSHGLSIMQYKNIAHRDIKPQNILIMNNGDYLICDFDESILVKKAYGSFDVRGTEMFICPILHNCVFNGVKKAKINIYKSDIYSLGLCFVYAMTKNLEVIKKIKRCNDDSLNKNLIINNFAGDEKYSNYFIDIIIQMIAYNEKERLDCINLDKLLNNKE